MSNLTFNFHVKPYQPIRPQTPALSTAATATEVKPTAPVVTEPAVVEPAADEAVPATDRRPDHRWGHHRGRSRHAHAQRSLHHLNRVVRHAVKDAVKSRDDLDQEDVKAYRELMHAFRDDLHAAFQSAGEDGELHTGVVDALSNLVDGLKALRTDSGDDGIEENLPVPEGDGELMIEDAPEPGGLVSLTA